MNPFDEAFDREPFPGILLRRGWKSLGRMKFALRQYELFFDTSSQFEVRVGGKLVASHYAKDEVQFLAILEKL